MARLGRVKSFKVQWTGSSTSLLLPLKRSSSDTPSTQSSILSSASRAWKLSQEVFDTYSTWRNTIRIGAYLAFAVFLTNLGLTIWAGTVQTASGLVFTQDCDKVEDFSTWIHLLFNILSTLLLGASNFAMQCLSAPTRDSVDKAHAKKQYVNIGVQSPRNLFRAKWQNITLWFILGVSSLPLHLLYNSMFFSSLGSYTYDVYFIKNDWLHGAWYDREFWSESVRSPPGPVFDGRVPNYHRPYDWKHFTYPNGTNATRYCPSCTYKTSPHTLQDLLSQNASRYEMMSLPDCIQKYAKSYVTDRSNVFLLGKVVNEEVLFDHKLYTSYHLANSSSGTNSSFASHRTRTVSWKRPVYGNSSLIRVMQGKDVQQNEATNFNGIPAWLCANVEDSEIYGCNQGQINAASDDAASNNFVLDGFQVTGCASETIDVQCGMNFNLPIAVVVVIMNLVKAICLYMIYLKIRDQPLLTLGDAIASFMKRPDEWSKDQCLAEHDHFTIQPEFPFPGVDPAYKRYRRRRGGSAGAGSWVGFLTFWTICFIVVCVLLSLAIQAIRSNGGISVIEAGMGKVTPQTLINGWQLPSQGDAATLAATLMANLPQLVLSGLYVLLNNLLTRLFIAQEWAGFSSHRKGLRVSELGVGSQRSTYFLAVPLRFGIPILALSTLLHWLASQSIFFAKIDQFSPSGIRDPSVTTCGFSPLAIILTLVVAVVIVIATFTLSLLPMQMNIPTAGSCSRAIAAACYPPKDGCDPTLPVKWGVVPHLPSMMEKEKTKEVKGELKEVGHCSFSSAEVDDPVEGELYE